MLATLTLFLMSVFEFLLFLGFIRVSVKKKRLTLFYVQFKTIIKPNKLATTQMYHLYHIEISTELFFLLEFRCIPYVFV